jgi:hypothetical protein
VASVTDPTGAHQHFTNRPTGTFFLLDDAARVDSSTAGIQSQLRLTMSEAADTVVIYRTTGVAGVNQLFAQATLSGESTVDQDSVVVRIPGLVALAGGGSVELTGDDPVHPQRYFGAPAMITALQTLAARVQAHAAEIAALPPAQRPSGTFPDRLAVNDMSLPWGGLFDLEGTWHHPHKEHRRGIEADVRVPREPEYDEFAFFVALVWEDQLSHSLLNERQARDHYHVRF